MKSKVKVKAGQILSTFYCWQNGLKQEINNIYFIAKNSICYVFEDDIHIHFFFFPTHQPKNFRGRFVSELSQISAYPESRERWHDGGLDLLCEWYEKFISPESNLFSLIGNLNVKKKKPLIFSGFSTGALIALYLALYLEKKKKEYISACYCFGSPASGCPLAWIVLSPSFIVYQFLIKDDPIRFYSSHPSHIHFGEKIYLSSSSPTFDLEHYRISILNDLNQKEEKEEKDNQ